MLVDVMFLCLLPHTSSTVASYSFYVKTVRSHTCVVLLEQPTSQLATIACYLSFTIGFSEDTI